MSKAQQVTFVIGLICESRSKITSRKIAKLYHQLSQINQLLIILNLATLHIKDASQTQVSLEIARQWHDGQENWFAWRVQALARHYQIFEQLPIKKCGGARKSRLWLYDEQVRMQT